MFRNEFTPLNKKRYPIWQIKRKKEIKHTIKRGSRLGLAAHTKRTLLVTVRVVRCRHDA